VRAYLSKASTSSSDRLTLNFILRCYSGPTGLAAKVALPLRRIHDRAAPSSSSASSTSSRCEGSRPSASGAVAPFTSVTATCSSVTSTRPPTARPARSSSTRSTSTSPSPRHDRRCPRRDRRPRCLARPRDYRRLSPARHAACAARLLVGPHALLLVRRSQPPSRGCPSWVCRQARGPRDRPASATSTARPPPSTRSTTPPTTTPTASPVPPLPCGAPPEPPTPGTTPTDLARLGHREQRPGRCPRRCPCLRARSRGRVLEILDQAVASADQAPACVVVGPIPGLPARVTRLGCVMWETRNLWPPTEARWTSCWGISAKMRDPSDRLTAESAELVYTFGRVVVNLSRMEPTSWAGPGPPRPPHRFPR